MTSIFVQNLWCFEMNDVDPKLVQRLYLRNIWSTETEYLLITFEHFVNLVSMDLLGHAESEDNNFTRMPWCQTPSRKKKATMFTTVTTSAYQDPHIRICEKIQVRGTPPKHDAAQNKKWSVALTVSHMASWADLGHSKRPRFPDLLPSVWRSGHARLTRIKLTDCPPIWNFINNS